MLFQMLFIGVITARERSSGKVVFSVMSVILSAYPKEGAHVTTACNAIGQSQITWEHPPPRPVQTCSLCGPYNCRQVCSWPSTEMILLSIK